MSCVEVRREISGVRSLLPELVPGIRFSPEARGPFVFTLWAIPSVLFLVFVLSESKMQLFSHCLSDKSCFRHKGQVQLQRDQTQIGEGGWWKSHCCFFSDPRHWFFSVCLPETFRDNIVKATKVYKGLRTTIESGYLETTSLGWHDMLCLCPGHQNPGGTTLTQKQKSIEPWRCVFDTSTSISGETVTSRSIRGPGELQSVSRSNVGSCHPLYSLQGEVQLRIFMDDFQAAEIQHSPNLDVSRSWNVWDQLPFTLYHS